MLPRPGSRRLPARLERVGVVPSETRLEQTAGFMAVSPEYFPLLDIQVVEGRAFTSREADEGAAVALVSAATARAFWPGLDPIGQALEIRRLDVRSQGVPAHTSVRIIGVTEDVAGDMLFDKVNTTCVYFADECAIAAGDVAPRAQSRRRCRRPDRGGERGQHARSRCALSNHADAGSAGSRGVDVPGVFDEPGLFLLGVVGLLLAFSGTYAVVAFLVAQRTPEFGIRMALGASVRQIVSAMMNETLRVALIGLGAGLWLLAIAVVRGLSAAIEIVPRFGARPYVVGVAIVLAATMVAALLPSLRASRIDPSKALRAE